MSAASVHRCAHPENQQCIRCLPPIEEPTARCVHCARYLLAPGDPRAVQLSPRMQCDGNCDPPFAKVLDRCPHCRKATAFTGAIAPDDCCDRSCCPELERQLAEFREVLTNLSRAVIDSSSAWVVRISQALRGDR